MDKLFNLTIGQYIEKLAKEFPNKTALKYIEQNYACTFSELDNKTDIIAKGLLGMGLRKGDHIGIWDVATFEWVITYMSAVKVGIIPVSINTSFRYNELKYLLEQSDCRALFFSNGFKDVDYSKIINELCPELAHSKPGYLCAEEVSALRIVTAFGEKGDGMYHFSEVEKFAGKITEEEFGEVKSTLLPDEVASIIYTSGTSGNPKGVMLTHSNILNNSYAVGACQGMTSEDISCYALPLFHSGGLSGGLFAALTYGATVIMHPYFSPTKVMESIQNEKCTHFSGVPTIYLTIVNHPNFDKYDLSSLRRCLINGTILPTHLYEHISNKLPTACLLNGYGLTESSPGAAISAISDSYEKRKSTVGKALPFVEIKIVDTETGLEVPVGEPGELYLRGYNVMKGYYRMPEETKKVLDKDGWLRSGDSATVDADGYYTIIARIKDIIIKGGENVVPKEIEDFICALPTVSDSQVVSIPSDKYGEEVFAYVILDKGMVATEDEIMQYLKQNIANYKVPSYIRFIDSFPINANGKIQKYKLREMAREYVNNL